MNGPSEYGVQKLLLSPDSAFLLQCGFSGERLVRLARQAEYVGVSPHQHLLANGLISETSYYRALANAARLPFIADPDTQLKFSRSLSMTETGIACRAGMAHVEGAVSDFYITAPYGRNVELLLKQLAENPALKNRLAMTTPTAFREALLQQSADSVLEHSVNSLHALRPHDSARRSFKSFFLVSALAIGAIALAVLHHAEVYAPVIGAISAALYLAACYYRIQAYGDYFEIKLPPPLRLDDTELPTCSVLVPLYREARIVAQLVDALDRIEYPRAKLDVVFLVEQDDVATREAIKSVKPGGYCRVIVVPPGHPRTKPRALQVGLGFAHGEIVTIFDAEDIPHPAQLRKAAEMFHAGSEDLACLQAELRIDNAGCSWLSKQFALEYAALFNVFLPSLAKRNLPVLLGGTSNYFRTSVLRQAGGWDPWNVTEDADLGIRLARAGYRIGTIGLPTEEEAPVSLRNWLQQRLRWQKGWMQTFIVHFSQPRTLLRELGFAKSWTLLATLGVSLLSAFAYPVFMVLFAADVLLDVDVLHRDFFGASVFGMSLAAFAGGHIFPLLHIHAGAKQTGQKLTALSLLTVWAYWLLVSIAAYAALFSLLRAPHHWAKTEHLGRPKINSGRLTLPRRAASTLGRLPRPYAFIKEAGVSWRGLWRTDKRLER